MKRLSVFLPAMALALAAQTPRYPNYPSETPAKFEPVTSSFDYARRDVMIPMRDGVKLHTVVLVPNGASRAPILLTRTPYNADELTGHSESSHLGPLLKGSDSSLLNGCDNPLEVILEGGYIRAVRDVRGKYKSEGDYVMNRPLSGPPNPTPVDHATDTYDTIDWLVKNTPTDNQNHICLHFMHAFVAARRAAHL
jgi:predicted acyl esterase